MNIADTVTARGFHEEPQVLHYDSRETNVIAEIRYRSPSSQWSTVVKEIRTHERWLDGKTKDLESACLVI